MKKLFHHRNFQRLEIWLRRVSFSRKLLYILVILTFASGVATYLSFLNGVHNTQLLSLIKINILFLVAFFILFATRLFFNRKKTDAGPRFHSRLVMIFSFLAITPTLVVYLTSSTLFERGVQALGGDFTKHVIQNSSQFAHLLQLRLEEDLKAIGSDITTNLSNTSLKLDTPLGADQQLLINKITSTYNLSQLAFLNAEKELIYSANADSPFPLLDENIWNTFAQKNVVTFFPAKKTSLASIVEISLDKKYFLYIEKPIDPFFIKHFEFIQLTNIEFIKIQHNRWLIPFMFMLNYGLFVLISLFIAIGVGIMLADHIASPITQLVAAAQRIRKGHLDTRVKIKPNIIEFLGLAKAFNLMVSELQSQKTKLETANNDIERRKSFIETTLSSLSSGVIGLDDTNHIKVINAATKDILALEKKIDIIGQHILDVLPEVSDLLYETSTPSSEKSLATSSQRLIIVERDGLLNYFSVQISTTKSSNDIQKVLTIENTTELHLAQKKAAWGDVARRVAHEIKNPLTPIQLSAERLKRKLSNLLPTTELEPLNTNIETIIRQVTEIERIVREFSQLSRMPTPNFSEHNLITILNNCINLQIGAYDTINFEFQTDKIPKEVIVLCDEQLLGQAITNILKNAVESLTELPHLDKFSPKVLILLTLNDKNVTINMVDNGKGFPLNMLDKFLEPYVTTKQQGTGLGLAISKKIIEDHNGQLTLNNLKPAGAKVSITLPLHIQV